MTTKLSDLVNGSNDSSSTDSDSSADSAPSTVDELRGACEAIGADHESAQRYVDENGSKDDLIDFAERLADDDDLWRIQEEYRRLNDIHRIRRAYLYDVADRLDASFSTWSSAFYGDSDDPSEGTYNAIQQKSRSEGGNLAYYKALFPEPVERFWDSEPVLYTERPGDDSHIYVSAKWVDEYSDFTFEYDGETLIRPPTDEEIDQMAGSGSDSNSSSDTSGDAPFAPGTYTVDGLRDALGTNPGEEYSVSELEALLEAEESGEDRKTAKKAIRGALNQARDSQSNGQQTLDESGSSPGGSKESPAARAGRLLAEHGIDTHPDAVTAMLENGMTEEQVVEALT